MSKIICEICGTKYPDTADQCPICGYTNDVTAKTETEEVLEEVVQEARPKSKGGKFSKAKTRKQDEEEIRPIPVPEEDEDEDDYDDDDYDDDDDEDDDYDDDDDEDDDDDDDDDDEEEGSGVVLNILLGVVIVALLCVSGFIFVKYFLPNVMDSAEPTLAPTEAIVETEAPETEEPTIPCEDLSLEETEVVLNEIGQMYLLNVEVTPADTTDVLTFTVADESIVTCNDEGRLTAVGEGETTVTIACGDLAFDVSVVVTLVEETEAPTEEPTEAPTEEPTEAPTEPGVTKTVISDWVKIRSGAGTEYEEVGKYVEGDVVVIYEEKVCRKGRNWGRTDKGWICTEYVK